MTDESVLGSLLLAASVVVVLASGLPTRACCRGRGRVEPEAGGSVGGLVHSISAGPRADIADGGVRLHDAASRRAAGRWDAVDEPAESPRARVGAAP